IGLLQSMGRTQEQILATLHELGPECHFPENQQAVDLNNRAIRLYKAGRYAEAESLLCTLLAVNENSGASDNDELADTLDVFGQCLKHLKRYAEAEAVMRHSLEIRIKSTPQDTSKTAVSLNNLGQLLYRVKRYPEAQPLLLNALDIL